MNLSVDGHDVYAYTGARAFVAEQPSVLLLHGAGLDHTVWILQSRYLAHHGYNVLALDLPGHGRSAGALLESIDAIAEWVIRVADCVGAQRFAVLGHSMGSLIALRTAAIAGERAALAGLLAIALPMAVAPPLLNAARANEREAYDMINIWGHGYAARIGANTAPGMWMVGSANRLLERGGEDVLFNDLNACNEYRSGLEDASKLVCPALVLLGRNDIMASPRQARDLIEAISRASVHELDDCGHMLMAEQPDRTLDLIYAALRDAF